jgi:3-hexulose-6-phosphate synthase
MKLHFTFDVTDLDKALQVAAQVVNFCDAFQIGSLLVYKYGAHAVKVFQEKFPQKDILVHARIADKGKDATTIFSDAGADWLTVLTGSRNDTILATCTFAHSLNKKVMVDLIDSSSPGQSALEAKNLGADALLFHQPYDEKAASLTMIDNWEMVRGNTQLPIFITGKIKRESIELFMALKPAGLVIGKAVVEADNPHHEAAFFYELCGRE